MKFISYLKTKMKNTTLNTFILAMMIVVAGTLGLSMMAEANSKLRDLESDKGTLLHELSDLRSQKIETKNTLLAASGAYFTALENDTQVAKLIEAKRDQIERVERLIMSETGEDFIQTSE